MPRTFALVDCNNFYVSCERAFRPDLAARPVVVLSSNDGCIIARSEEAKALGITMGVPEFKARALLRKHEVAVFSSNYALYGDLSHRIMHVLRQHAARMEPYSIDEAFLELKLPEQDLEPFARALRERVRQWVGIPVSIGIAPTKTLAKVANRIGKKRPEAHGVTTLLEPESIDVALADVPVDDVWGIGYRYAAQLHRCGIDTALQFAQRDDKWIRTHMTILGLRTAYELRGMSCIEMAERAGPRKELVVSRTFGTHVPKGLVLESAIAAFASRVAEKLRRERLLAGSVAVFLNTDRFRTGPQDHCSVSLQLEVPTRETDDLVYFAQQALAKLAKPGFEYRKAGVIAHDLTPDSMVQETLFSHNETGRINQPRRPCPNSVDPTWEQRANHLSPRYTTRWNELLEVI